MLRIMVGRARSGKSTHILREIKERGDSSRQVLLVPEHASHQAEVDLCRVCGDTASRHAEVLSFRTLATRVLSATGGLSDVTLDAGGKLLVLQKALREVAPELRVYRRPSQKAAFLEQMLGLFDEFSSYAVEPERLWAEAEGIPGAMGDKLRDLALLYGAYEARLHRPGFDARDRMRKLCDHLEESGYLDGTEVYLDGFSYFNGLEQRLISVILRRAASVTVTLLGEKESEGESEIFEVSLRTRELLARLAKDAGCGWETVYVETPDLTPLGHLERCFFGETKVWAGPAPGIRLLEAETPITEVERVAGEILRLTTDGAYRFREITVAARNMDTYASIIENVFARYGIPTYLSRRSDILETPVLALLTGALNAVTGGFEYEDLFRCFKTGLAGLTPEECDLLENYVLKWEIHGAMWLRDTDWSANPDGYGAPWGEEQTARLAAVNALRARVRLPLLHLTEGLRSGETVEMKVNALYSYLEELSLQQTLTERMERLAGNGRPQAAEETAQLWSILCDVLDQFTEILGEERLETEEFVRLLQLVLTQYSVGTIPAALDQVHVNEITRNDRHTARVVFLLGANDHVLPAVAQSGGILNDDDREELAGLGIPLAPTGLAQFHIELQNLYAALAQPTERLTVSYPLSDVSGAPERPAFVIGRIQTLFPSIKVEPESTDKEYRLTALQPALESAGEAPGGPLWTFFAGKPAFAERLETMARAAGLTRGRLSRPAVRALYGGQFRMSASRLETLNSCHFAYFMQYGLRAKEREGAGFDAPQIGTFLHFVLESVTRAVKDRGGFAQVSRPTLRELTRAAIDEYVGRELQNFQERDARFRYLFSRLRETAYTVVEQTADELAHSDFVPLEFELSFGDGGALPAVEISEPGGEMRVTGKVDRVDGWIKDGRLYLRVVDYKTGRKSFDLAEVRMGLDIQMLLYLFTLGKEGEARFGCPVEPAGVLYLPARDEILPAERNITPEQLQREREKSLRRSGLLLNEPEVLEAMEHEALTEPHYLPLRINKAGEITDGVASAAQLGRLGLYLEQLLHRIVRELRDGNIDADPCCHNEEDSYCRFCPWAPACHFEDGRGGDHLHYIVPVKPAEFWEEIRERTEGGEDGGCETD